MAVESSKQGSVLGILREARLLHGGRCIDLENHRLPHPGPFLALLRERMPELEELKLSHNGLTELPDAIGNLTSLRYLYLYNNALKSLPGSIGRMASLVMLHLANNVLEELPESIGNLPSLDRLDADHNVLRTLPESIGDLPKLRRLDVAGNQLTSLPRSITHLGALEYLNLANNRLAALPEGIGKLVNLTRLILVRNQLRELPESIGDLSKLEQLELTENRLEWLPHSIGKLHVTVIRLGSNRLRTLPDSISQIEGVQDVDLRNNPLRSLPEGLHVDSLNISNCVALTSLPADLVVRDRLELGGTSLRPPMIRHQIGRITWNRVQIDWRIAFRPETITHTEILNERNAERRRVMLERMGYEKFIRHAGARTLNEDTDPGGERRLLCIDMKRDEDLVCLSVQCPSTGHAYILRVPPHMRTCRQAAAWIAGFDNPDDYHPLIET